MVSKRICLFSLCIACGVGSAVAQVLNQSALEKSLESRALQSSLGREDQSLQALRSPAMEGAVDPSKYVVGPSDLFQVSVWGPTMITFSVPVTPEGSIIVPTVGTAVVNNMNLTGVKDRVSQMMRRKYPVGDITVTLLRPRSFIVTLRGAVPRQGQYIATAVERLEKVLADGASSVSPTTTAAVPLVPSESTDPLLQRGLINLPELSQSTTLFGGASTRNILVIRRGGDTLHADIPKFYTTGEDRYNPYLRDGDIIFVPQKDLTRNFVAVYGAVNAPGRYEYAEGDSLLGVIGIAQGLTKAADPKRVVITRLSADGEEMDETEIDLSALMQGRSPDILLKRGDRIVVPAIIDERRNYTVVVGGEVNIPGEYPITRNSTRLSKVLRDAGGVTNNALLSGSILMRRDDSMKDLFAPQLTVWRNLRSQQVTAPDSNYFNLDLRLARHPVVVDFAKLINEHDSTQDVVLRHDDVIFIASDHQTVLVDGQVANPGYVPYVPGADFEYYIQKAGGFSELAVEGDARVIKKGTLEWVEPAKTHIEPGDKIWVPKKPIRDFAQYISIFRDVVSAAAALATVVILAIQVSHN